MYRGFNLKTNFTFEEYSELGEGLYETYKNNVRNKLDKYLSKNGILDGSAMQEDWFPEIKADIFISHSHMDEKNAIGLAGWLHKQFGLTSFIDSCIWGHSDELLLEIDKTHCQINPGSYSYESRNRSTSHVHMMLLTALNKMIDNSECLFFLSTPESITTSEAIINKTKSPWIYAELEMSRLIRKKYHRTENYINERKNFSKAEDSIDESLEIEYEVDTNHLLDINATELNNWNRAFRAPHSTHALDVLYNQHSQKSIL